MQQFLEDQKKKEEERVMKITLKLELSQMKEQMEVTGTPNINSKSKKIAERIRQEHISPRDQINAEVYNRLYEMGKHRVHQRNQTGDTRYHHTPNKGTNLSNLHCSTLQDGQHSSQLSATKDLLKSD
jgi:hypothetical protein